MIWSFCSTHFSRLYQFVGPQKTLAGSRVNAEASGSVHSPAEAGPPPTFPPTPRASPPGKSTRKVSCGCLRSPSCCHFKGSAVATKHQFSPTKFPLGITSAAWHQNSPTLAHSSWTAVMTPWSSKDASRGEMHASSTLQVTLSPGLPNNAV